MYVIGTAGHVDHGKSTLVEALTGIDPDRLAEEKQRGMTIDLGFAWVTLPSGREASIVDVPGHERFIKNMLAGVGGIDLALLVVAADESVMPQTREHLAILDLLGVDRGIAVLTKADLVDADLLALAQLEVEELLAGTTLAGAPVLAVSAVTGDGLPGLAAALDGALDAAQQRRDLGRPRLPVDRSFTVAGFGTVVTGTLIGGALQAGQAVDIVPSGLRSRIRGLQSHRHAVETAGPGSRVAVNLTGIGPEDVARGDVVTLPGWLRPTKAVDARLRLLDDAPHAIRHNVPVTFHAFAAETPAKMRLLEADELGPGGETWAQVWLEHPLALVRGDRFVVRSADATLGGGTIVDVDAKRHRRRHIPTIDRLDRLAKGSPTAQLLTALEGREPADAATLARRANIAEAEALSLANEAVAEGSVVALSGAVTASTPLYTAAAWARVSSQAQRLLAAFHAQNPLREGMTREEMRSRLGLRGEAGQLTLSRLVESGAVVGGAAVLRLPEHAVSVSGRQQASMDAFVAALERDPFGEPPALPPDLLGLLADQGRVVRAGQGVVFAAAPYARLEAQVTAHLRAHGAITVAEVRDLLGTSRKFALALLEHLDDEKVTRRLGDQRVLLRD